MYRGTTKDGREVFGWLNHNPSTKKYYISNCWFKQEFCGVQIPSLNEVIPETIAMDTGQTDKNGIDIYGSFKLDGVMTKGGDVVERKEEHDIDCFDVETIITKWYIMFNHYEGMIVCHNILSGNETRLSEHIKDIKIIGKQYEVNKCKTKIK